MPPEAIAQFLTQFADRIEAAKTALVEMAHVETALPKSPRLGNIKRSFEELAGYLCRSQSFPHGAVLLTGTGIVPPDDFTLREHDVVEIEIAPIGVLRNSVVIV